MRGHTRPRLLRQRRTCYCASQLPTRTIEFQLFSMCGKASPGTKTNRAAVRGMFFFSGGGLRLPSHVGAANHFPVLNSRRRLPSTQPRFASRGREAEEKSECNLLRKNKLAIKLPSFCLREVMRTALLHARTNVTAAAPNS